MACAPINGSNTQRELEEAIQHQLNCLLFNNAKVDPSDQACCSADPKEQQVVQIVNEEQCSTPIVVTPPAPPKRTTLKPQKVTSNKILVKLLYKLPQVSHWDSKARLETQAVRVPVEMDDEEMDELEYEMGGVSIISKKRVENIFLFAQFLLRKEFRKNTEDLKTGTEWTLYHSTKHLNIRDICTYSFDWRLAGTARGHKYGQGVSFAEDAAFAITFPYKYTSNKVLIAAKVLSYKSHVGDEDTVLPDSGFDTTCNEKETVFVKYDDNDFYPEYCIFFEEWDGWW